MTYNWILQLLVEPEVLIVVHKTTRQLQLQIQTEKYNSCHTHWLWQESKIHPQQFESGEIEVQESIYLVQQ